jgi:hypothetical protein
MVVERSYRRNGFAIQCLKQGKPAAYARQQESFRFPEAGRGSLLSTQLKNARSNSRSPSEEGH